MKRMKRIGAFLLLVILSISMTSCIGSPKSAYDVALENGFVGSAADWLSSLKGQDLDIRDVYDAAVQNGYSGDFLTFLSEFLSFDAGELLESTKKEPINIATALLSSVSVSCKFRYRVDNWGFSSTKEASQAGSGVIYRIDKENGDAYILTNYHVVYYYAATTANKISDDISIFLYGKEDASYAIPATYVGGSMQYDIAVLRIEGSEILRHSDAVAVTPVNSNKIAVGSTAIAIGNAAGLGISVTQGIVSVDSENITMTAADNESRVTYRLLRVDTAVNEGNSGGGLFSSDGKLIGIVNAKISSSTVENIAYAIPANVAVSVAENIIDTCTEPSVTSVHKCQLGITVIAADSAAYFDPSTQSTLIRETVMIEGVNRNTLAYGKLRAGDIITKIEINGISYDVDRVFVIVDAMLDVRIGDTVSVSVIRDASPLELDFVASDASFTRIP